MKKRLKKILILAVFPIVLFLTLGIVSFVSIFATATATTSHSGAVYVGNGSKFNMKSGSISGFNATNGGGVYVYNVELSTFLVVRFITILQPQTATIFTMLALSQ